jgi:hypothetical protein
VGKSVDEGHDETIVMIHILRQQGQSLLNVDQRFRLKAGAEFLQG